MKYERCVEEVLMRGCDDWVQLAELVSIIEYVEGAMRPLDIQNAALGIIRDVLHDDLMEVGDVDVAGEWQDKEGFRKWELDTAAALQRIEQEWQQLGRNPTLWEICWLNNTPKGDEVGKALLRRRRL